MGSKAWQNEAGVEGHTRKVRLWFGIPASRQGVCNESFGTWRPE
jgi:hypothetical protein